MPISHVTNGFPNGVTIQSIPLVTTRNAFGNVFHVDSEKGSNGNKGIFTSPFATIAYAITRCTANQGDLIVVAAGHTEIVVDTNLLIFDVAGITVLFMGEGSNRASIRFTTNTASDIAIGAADVTLVNPRFVAQIDGLIGAIDVAAQNFKIINGEYYDGIGVDTTRTIGASPLAAGLKIYGWKYIAGNESGTQKQSHIVLDGVDNAELVNIDIAGDFATGNIENVTDEVLNIRFENIKLNNTNATPAPGIVLDANATGWAKNVDVRVASGTTYVSSVAKLNWDKQCLGYNTDGKGGTDIATFA
jgi:hypothetical protein